LRVLQPGVRPLLHLSYQYLAGASEGGDYALALALATVRATLFELMALYAKANGGWWTHLAIRSVLA